MKTIAVSISEEQIERLKDEQRRSGAPISLQVRRALDVHIAMLDSMSPERVAETMKHAKIVEATGGPKADLHWTEQAAPNA